MDRHILLCFSFVQREIKEDIIPRTTTPSMILKSLQRRDYGKTNDRIWGGISSSPSEFSNRTVKEMKVNWASSPGNTPKQDTSSGVLINLPYAPDLEIRFVNCDLRYIIRSPIL
ncbi:hypothetical protein TNIN_386341 [Trichonephila inaurata madagascariensis]|uniref:Uncharacterized protein n=1 Tax=Trichonephila inaurata madagascariensis TaxID=2747483 RepID=A0A8X6XD55_9ARAC|nr:hypothetical protein TNIN_386341 [Trichonephila inaurata madagascariensis]